MEKIKQKILFRYWGESKGCTRPNKENKEGISKLCAVCCKEIYRPYKGLRPNYVY
jgi:hypothetical protein